MNHELFSATPFELHQSIAQHLPSGFASGPVFDAVQQGIKAVAMAKKPALQYVCSTSIGASAGPVELQYEVSHAGLHAGEVDSLRVMVDGVNIVNHLEESVIAKLDAHCLEHYATLYEMGSVNDECPSCAGTSEGQFEGARCGACRGKGSRK